MLAVILAIKLPTILILAWAFSRPEEMFRPGRRYWAVLAIAVVHVLLALLSLTGEKSSLSELFVAYPLIWAVLLRDRLRHLLHSPASAWLMAVAICVLLWFEETWVIVDHHSPPCAALHPLLRLLFRDDGDDPLALLPLPLHGSPDVRRRRTLGRADRATIRRAEDGFLRGCGPGSWLRALHLPRVWPLPCGTPAALLRGVQPVEPDEPLAGHVAVPGDRRAAVGYVAALVSDPPGIRI